MSSMLYILGAKLAEVTRQKELVCRGMIRISIEESAAHLQQTTDHKVWQEYLNTMSFRDWDAILQGQSLTQRLKNIGVTNPAEVITKLQNTLVEKQSLLTMSAH